MIRFSTSAVIAFVVTVTALPAADEERRGPTNVILIVADDLGAADLGCYGSTFHKTPHLDRLARDGVRFTQAYAACPVCSPTRAALMTGDYPARLHLTDWLPGRNDRSDQRLARPKFRQELPLEAVTIAEVLQRRKIATAHIGKWHLGGEGFEPTRQGFDLNIGGDRGGSPVSYFAPFGRGNRVMPGLQDAPQGEYLTDRLTTEAEKFIEQNKERAFFLYMPHFAVHTPLQAPADRISKFPGQAVPGKQSNATYAAMLEALDDSVGRIRKKLDELKLADRTAILFTSDNGGLATVEGPKTPSTINSPYREGKGWLYEGGIRVPLIAYWPGFSKAGATVTAPVMSIDLAPTIARMADANDPPVGVDGVDISGLIRGDTPNKPRPLFWHYPHYSNQGGRPGGAVREGDWKLIEFYEDGRRELFDVEHDVSESRNLAAEKPEIVARLAQRLDDFREAVKAQAMTPNPDFVPNPQDKEGRITLHARTAQVHGAMLRYEPLPHKNTLGYWVNADDSATWEFTVAKPGTFTVQILQGCGTGSGGSTVEFTIDGQTLTHTVADTGGFQNFVEKPLGEVTIATPGRHTLTVKPKTKPGVAVMDLRRVTLALKP